MRVFGCAALLALCGCSEYDFAGDAPKGPGDDFESVVGNWDDTGDPGTNDTAEPGDTGSTPELPQDGIPWQPPSEDCAEGVPVTITNAPLVVLAWSPDTATGTIDVPRAGWYHLWDTTPAESGASQQNESTMVRMTNTVDPVGAPFYTNCGDDFVVLDADNGGAPPARIYMGTFWLEGGVNTLTLRHLCPTIRAGSCTSMHNTADPGSTCESGSPNSAHLQGGAVCLVPAR